MAICRINPQTLRRHTPYNDYKTLEQVARAMERKKYGLEVDRGISDVDGPRKSQAARRHEARIWEKSFETHTLDNKAAILTIMTAVPSWQALPDEALFTEYLLTDYT